MAWQSQMDLCRFKPCKCKAHKRSKGGAQMGQENAVDSFLYYLRKFLQISLDGICQEQRILPAPQNQNIKFRWSLEQCLSCAGSFSMGLRFRRFPNGKLLNQRHKLGRIMLPRMNSFTYSLTLSSLSVIFHYFCRHPTACLYTGFDGTSASDSWSCMFSWPAFELFRSLFLVH